MPTIRSSILASAVALAASGSIAFTTVGAEAAPAPGGALVSARAALHGWNCDPIADEKFACTDAVGAGFVVVQRPIANLPKWQDDPEMRAEIAVVRRTYFLTVSGNAELSAAQFAAVKNTVAHEH